MAERRINRRSQIMQSKKPPPVIVEEDEHSHSIGTEKTVITKPKDATVEVTVKVKKRRDKDKTVDTAKKLIPLQEKEFRKGSWGDLLSSRTSLNRKESERDTTLKDYSKKTVEVISKKDRKSDGRNCDNDHSPLCQKIPLTDDLYLETHTHFRKTHSSERQNGDEVLVKQNEDLRREIIRLRKEIEVAKVRSGSRINYYKETPVTSRVPESHQGRNWEAVSSKRGLTQGTQTSTTSLLLSPKKGQKSSVDVVDGIIKASNKLPDTQNQVPTAMSPAELAQLETMKMQNDELRQQIAKLMVDINQTRSENCEFVSTIKELHQTADALIQANRELQEKHNLLILNHHGQQALQDQLLQIVSHNVQMKEALEVLLSKQNSPNVNAIDDNQLAQFRNVIKDVKSTIAYEMQGLNTGHPSLSSASVVQKYTSNSAFNLGESFLNDTNASEIRNILASQPLETRRGGNINEEGSSSTQYLNIEGLTGFESGHYRPSPLAVSKFSPRISTPNSFSNFSMSLSEAGASAFQQPTVDPTNMNNWRALEDEVSRSFIPVRHELSNCSTSSYTSGSTSSSPNPSMMRQ